MIDIVNMMFLDSPESGEGSSTRHSDGTVCCFVFQRLHASTFLGEQAAVLPPWRRSIAAIPSARKTPSHEVLHSQELFCGLFVADASALPLFKVSTLYAAAGIGLRDGWLDLIKIDRVAPRVLLLHLDMHGSSH